MGSIVESRIYNPGFFGRTLHQGLANSVVKRAGEGKLLSKAVMNLTLLSARMRYNFEAESGHYLPQRGALNV